jgi:hypothetical protein
MLIGVMSEQDPYGPQIEPMVLSRFKEKTRIPITAIILNEVQTWEDGSIPDKGNDFIAASAVVMWTDTRVTLLKKVKPKRLGIYASGSKTARLSLAAQRIEGGVSVVRCRSRRVSH